MNGIFNFSKASRVSSDVWYFALSRSMIESNIQSGISSLSLETNYLKKSRITSLSVLEWLSEKYTLPSVSNAAIRAKRGLTALSVIVQGALVGHHIRRLYSVSEIQDSSTLIILLPWDKISSIIREYYWRSTRHRSEFA